MRCRSPVRHVVRWGFRARRPTTFVRVTNKLSIAHFGVREAAPRWRTSPVRPHLVPCAAAQPWTSAGQTTQSRYYMKLPRVLKAIAGTAVTWGVAWFCLSVLALLVQLGMTLGDTPAAKTLWSWATHSWAWFAQGAVLGASFAALLHVASRRLTAFRRLTLPVVGIVGAVAAGTVSLLIFGPALGCGRTGVHGAGCKDCDALAQDCTRHSRYSRWRICTSPCDSLPSSTGCCGNSTMTFTSARA